MRAIVFALILSIILGGFSSASHALGDVGCTQISIEKSDQCLSNQDPAEKSDSGKSDQTIKLCMDCLHCCGSHIVLNENSYSMSILPQAAVLNSWMETYLASDFITSLLRPPRSFV